MRRRFCNLELVDAREVYRRVNHLDLELQSMHERLSEVIDLVRLLQGRYEEVINQKNEEINSFPF